MSKFRFKPEDFYPMLSANEPLFVTSYEVAVRANHLLDEHLAKCRVVFGYINPSTSSSSWSTNPPNTFSDEDITHQAVIFNIEERVKEECKHDPVNVPAKGTYIINGKSYQVDMDQSLIRCKHCGIKLKATWEAAE